jgi:hypothetical protein
MKIQAPAGYFRERVRRRGSLWQHKMSLPVTVVSWRLSTFIKPSPISKEIVEANAYGLLPGVSVRASWPSISYSLFRHCNLQPIEE